MKNIKNLPHTGKVDAATHAQARAALLRSLPDAVFETAPSRFASVWMLTQTMVYRPVAVMSAALVFLAGGWMTTSAAQGSLPGDTLYNIKRVTERAQLQVASLDRRAVLHTEFANRRLEEVAALQETAEAQPNRAPLITKTVAAYQAEIASATEDLQELSADHAPEAFAVAAEVLENVTLLAQNAEDLRIVAQGDVPREDGALPVEATVTQEVSLETEVIDQVTQTASAIEEVATDVALSAHEAEPTLSSRQEMEDVFRQKLGTLEARRVMILHRVEKIEQISTEQKALLAQANVILPEKNVFSDIKKRLQDQEKSLPEIMDHFAAGGFRTGLDALANMSNDMGAMEITLMGVEEQIMQALTQAGT